MSSRLKAAAVARACASRSGLRLSRYARLFPFGQLLRNWGIFERGHWQSEGVEETREKAREQSSEGRVVG